MIRSSAKYSTARGKPQHYLLILVFPSEAPTPAGAQERREKHAAEEPTHRQELSSRCHSVSDQSLRRAHRRTGRYASWPGHTACAAWHARCGRRRTRSGTPARPCRSPGSAADIKVDLRCSPSTSSGVACSAGVAVCLTAFANVQALQCMHAWLRREVCTCRTLCSTAYLVRSAERDRQHMRSGHNKLPCSAT